MGTKGDPAGTTPQAVRQAETGRELLKPAEMLVHPALSTALQHRIQGGLLCDWSGVLKQRVSVSVLIRLVLFAIFILA